MRQSIALALVVVHLVAMVGCAARQPRELFAPIPPAEEPDLPELDAHHDECPAPAAMRPGEMAPYVDATGEAECAAVVLPNSTAAAAWRDAQERLPWAMARWDRCEQGRADDRSHCQRLVEVLEEDRDGYRRESNLWRAATPAAAVIGVIIGVAVGLAADDLAEVVP